jgi:hypothetical protein
MAATARRFGRWVAGLVTRLGAWLRAAPGLFLGWTRTHPAEALGYVVWGFMTAVIAVPEIWAAVDSEHVPWPTISGMTGHLEVEHAWVSFVVIALLVWLSVHAVIGFRQTATGSGLVPLGRTGHLTTAGALGGRDRALLRFEGGSGQSIDPLPSIVYFPAAALLVAIGIYAAHRTTGHDKYTFGEILYGLLFFFAGALPGFIAWRRQIVVFPTLFATIKNLERHMHVLALLLASALLFVHLVMYPWPSTIRDVNRLHTTYSTCHPLEEPKKPLTSEQLKQCTQLELADRGTPRAGSSVKPSAYAP